MRLVITGASGFIGRTLCARLLEQGHYLTLLTHGSPADGNSANTTAVTMTTTMID